MFGNGPGVSVEESSERDAADDVLKGDGDVGFEIEYGGDPD